MFIGSLLIILGSAATFIWPTADFWRGFVQSLSIISNLCGIGFFITAKRYAKREGRMQKEEEDESMLKSADSQQAATEE